jgi:hypothetical protein
LVNGILGLALYNPIWTNAVRTPRDFALAVGGFLLLTVWKAPPWVVVVLLATFRRKTPFFQRGRAGGKKPSPPSWAWRARE